MIKKQFTILALSVLAFSSFAADTASRLQFPLAGFSIAPLDTAPAEAVHQATVMMFLPQTDKFAANVGVIIQPFTGTIDEYATLTLRQFKDADMKVVSQKKLGQTGVVFEYTGQMHGNPLHWYARAEKSGTHVYLVTATAIESQWPKQAAQLKACVDSFKCDRK